jgi:hypothetical protein
MSLKCTVRLPLAALLCVFALPGVSAQATNDPLASGAAKLTLDSSFTRLLSDHGVKFSATAPATVKGPSATLPLATGTLDPTVGKGELETTGSLIFTRGNRRVVLRKVTVKTKPQPLLAKVGGGQLKLASGKLRFARRGFGSRLSAQHLLLTEKVATRLSKKLALRDVFSEGQPFATLRADVQPATVAILPAGRATLTPDPAFVAKLDKLFVSLNPIAPAERSPGPLFSVPIIGGGALAPDAGAGTLRSDGSLEFLQLGAGQIFWHELWLDPGAHQVLAEADIEPASTFPGKLGQVPVLALGAGSVATDPIARTIAISGAPLTLTAATAAYFNQAFAGAKEAFMPGELLGTASFSAQAQ